MTCRHPGCSKPKSTRGWCVMHYKRARKGKDMDAPEKGTRTCQVDGCTLTHHANGYCSLHHNRIRNGWDLHAPRRHVNKGANCRARACDRRADSLGYCSTHYSRIARGLDVDTPIRTCTSRAIPTFYAAHKQISKDRGRAAEYNCVDCGGSAVEWAYSNEDSAEIIVTEGKHRGLRYSLDPMFYYPKCRKCHKAGDARLAADELFAYRLWKHRTGLTLADFTPDG